MKEIHLCTANISGPVSSKTTVDIVEWLAAGFEEVGINLTVDAKQFRGDTPNIILEGFNAPFKPFLDQHRGKITLICFVTEIIDGERFDMAPGTIDGVDRYASFMSIADHYSGFLTSVESNVSLLSRIAPATFFEFGHSERLVRPSDPARWQHDFLFTGSLSPYRKALIEELSAVLPLHVPGGADASHTANALSNDAYLEEVGSAAVHIGLKQYANWKLPSPTKIGRALNAGAGCIVEKTEVTTRQSALVPTFVRPAEIREHFDPFDRGTIRADALERLAAYRNLLPLKAEVLRNLEECPPLTF